MAKRKTIPEFVDFWIKRIADESWTQKDEDHIIADMDQAMAKAGIHKMDMDVDDWDGKHLRRFLISHKVPRENWLVDTDDHIFYFRSVPTKRR